MTGVLRQITRRIIDAPEANIAIFGFLLNFVWEILQLPLIRGQDDRALLAASQGLPDRHVR